VVLTNYHVSQANEKVFRKEADLETGYFNEVVVERHRITPRQRTSFSDIIPENREFPFALKIYLTIFA